MKKLSVDENGKLWWRQSNKLAGSYSRGYLDVRINGSLYPAHTIAFCLYYGRWPLPKLVIDHINHNTLDNRKDNLREVTHAENQRNRKGLQINNTSGIPGVYWISRSNKWGAKLNFNGKVIYGGCHKELEDAIISRKLLEIDFIRG